MSDGTRQVFDTTGKQGESVMIAGISVLSGKLSRSHHFRVMRDDEVVKQGLKVASMQRFKDRVNEVMKGKVREIADFLLPFGFACLTSFISLLAWLAWLA